MHIYSSPSTLHRHFAPKRLGKLLLVGCAMVASVGVLPSAVAHAAAYDQLCETGEVCLSDGFNLLGNKFTTPSDEIGLDGYKYNGTNVFVLNTASSIQNRGSSSWRVLVYDGTWSGPVNCYQPGQISNSLPHAARGNLPNNAASSIDWRSGSSC